MSAAIQINNVSKTYENHIKAIDDISFGIDEGEVICILGQSGSGKSTLLRVLAGLEDVDDGNIVALDQKITGPSDNLVPGYNFIHFVTQDYRLPPFRTIEQTLDDELYDIKEEHLREARIDELMNLCRLQGKNKAYPRQLSGGERQRAAMAIALADDPDIVLMDEPFSNLDMLLKTDVRQEVFDILREAGVTVVMVSHDPADALSEADKVIILEAGKLIQMDKPASVYQKPKTHYAAKIMGPINNLSKTKAKINGKNLLIRPEQFRINTEGKFEGMIVKSRFQGMHYHLHIRSEISEKDLLIYNSEGLKVGEKVRFDI